MRRAAVLLRQAGAAKASAAASTEVAAAMAVPQMVRQMGGGGGGGGGGHGGPHPETPLSKVMPGIVALPRQVVSAALGLTGKLIVGAATSSSAKGAVTSIADKMVVDGAVVDLAAVDPSYWTYWLSTLGYNNQAGYKNLAQAAKPKVAGMTPCQISNLTTGFHNAKYYDKELFSAIASNISNNFTKFDTEQLLKITAAFADNGHYSVALFDDIADGLTYCNHYLAPVKANTAQVCAALGAFAKFSHERADMMNTLARGISELGLGKLEASERRAAVVAGLRAFTAFNFYPEQVDALLYYTKSEAGSFSADELAVAAKATAAIEAQTGGSLETWSTEAGEDAVDWYGHHVHAPQQYELFALRDDLVPKSYTPSSLRPGGK